MAALSLRGGLAAIVGGRRQLGSRPSKVVVLLGSTTQPAAGRKLNFRLFFFSHPNQENEIPKYRERSLNIISYTRWQ